MPKKPAAEAPQKAPEPFFFPDPGVTIWAADLAGAEEKLRALKS